MKPNAIASYFSGRAYTYVHKYVSDMYLIASIKQTRITVQQASYVHVAITVKVGFYPLLRFMIVIQSEATGNDYYDNNGQARGSTVPIEQKAWRAHAKARAIKKA